jgi:hypothetical protein
MRLAPRPLTWTRPKGVQPSESSLLLLGFGDFLRRPRFGGERGTRTLALGIMSAILAPFFHHVHFACIYAANVHGLVESVYATT